MNLKERFDQLRPAIGALPAKRQAHREYARHLVETARTVDDLRKALLFMMENDA